MALTVYLPGDWQMQNLFFRSLSAEKNSSKVIEFTEVILAIDGVYQLRALQINYL